ncbi:hypothetical protein ACHAWF_001013 [Thalassiosira exigua]
MRRLTFVPTAVRGGRRVPLKACAACKMVKYCNRDCQIAHHPQHNSACKKRSDELHDELLFRQPPQNKDCPICFLPLPRGDGSEILSTCCGKMICNGCTHAQIKEGIRSGKAPEEFSGCPFCRKVVAKTDEEDVEQINDLILFQLSYTLERGSLDSSEAYYSLGNLYCLGRGVERDRKKAIKYWELAAMCGYVKARVCLAIMEGESGNHQRAYRNFFILARAGDEECLKEVKEGFMMGIVTKDEYADALRGYQKSRDETKSEMRDEAVRYHANP